ncbi:ATP-binding protein [bacterium]|nr:ATP-binding protein [bacterium]
MPVSNLQDLLRVLKAADEGSLLGTEEADWVDFKGQPYWIPDASKEEILKGQTELAKDVAAFANQRGGAIIIGVKTKKTPGARREEAESVSRVPFALVDKERYREAIARLTYPPIRDVEIAWCFDDREAGLLYIVTPQAISSSFPILVTRTEVAFSRKDVFLCVPIRLGESTDRMDAAELHSEIQIGRVLRQQGVEQPRMSEPEDWAKEREDLLRELVSTLAAHDAPYFYLEAWPFQRASLELRNRFGADPLTRYLREPRQIREHGFGWRPYSDPRRLACGGLLYKGGSHAFALSKRGILVGMVRIDPDGMTWGNEERAINPLTLVEMTLCFFQVFEDIHQLAETGGKEYWAAFGMRNLIDDDPILLPPGPLSRHGSGRFPAAKPEGAELIGTDIAWVPQEAPSVSFRILDRIYDFFGLDTRKIPYVEDGRVTPEAFKGINW